MKVVVGFILGLLAGVGATYAYLGTQPEPAATAGMVFPQIVAGDSKAPVSVMEYSSVACGLCGEFKKNIWPKIKEKYIDTGQVQWTLRSFPLGNPDLKAAMLAHCHADPHMLMELYYKTQERWMMAADPIAEIKKIALEQGLSEDDIKQCWDDETLLNGLIQNRMYATQRHQLVGTPSFIVGKTVIPGYIPFEQFDELLEKALAHVQEGAPLDTFLLEEKDAWDKEGAASDAS